MQNFQVKCIYTNGETEIKLIPADNQLEAIYMAKEGTKPGLIGIEVSPYAAISDVDNNKLLLPQMSPNQLLNFLDEQIRFWRTRKNFKDEFTAKADHTISTLQFVRLQTFGEALPFEDGE